jgi:acetyl-CoA acyltransferase
VGAVHLVGVGETSFASAGRGADRLVREAIGAALADAGVRPGDIDGLALAADPDGEEAALGVLEGRVRHPLPPVCAFGGAALHVAWKTVASGARDMVLCVGHSRLGEAVGERAPIETLAAAAEQYMNASGASEEHFARVAVKSRRHGAHNPRALQTVPVDVAGVLASDVLVWPLRRLMVAPSSQGAAAIVLASRELGRRAGARAPRVRASVVVRGAETDDADRPSARAARMAYEAAGLGPEDVDCAEIDHPTSAGELAAYEALQFAPDGQGPELIESGFTALGGVLPVNTSGGALAQGETTGAAGIAQLCELAWQLRGEAGRRQVAGARVGLGLAAARDGDRSLVGLSILSVG